VRSNKIMRIANAWALQTLESSRPPKGSAMPATRSIKFPLVARAVAVLLIASLPIGAANANEDDDDEDGGRYSIGLWGDLPYNDAQALVGVPNLIADMNAQKLKFSVHDGDLKGGNNVAGSVTPTTCSNELYAQALSYFNALKSPAMFTPGDNDWTDCDRARNGGFNSLERLDYQRSIFFSTPYSLGQKRLKQDVQTGAPYCLSATGNSVPCVENRRWVVGKVVYLTLNVQGSCNNLCDVLPNPAEYAARNAANIAWLREAFAVAKQRNAAAVMIIAQADPGFDAHSWDAPNRDPLTLVQIGTDPDGFRDYLLALREETIAFRKPVAYVHGDSHFFRVDKPFLDAQGRRLENFTRVETFGNNAANGNNDAQWVKVSIDARSREVFSYTPMIVPGNRVAVPAP
jgi:hypothetical protein